MNSLTRDSVTLAVAHVSGRVRRWNHLPCVCPTASDVRSGDLRDAYLRCRCRSLLPGRERRRHEKMMGDMAVKPTGDVDADFVAMMVPHHQGAIDMALAVLRHGRNPQIRRLAQEIIVTQQQEIAVMRLAVGQPLPPSRPSPLEVPPLAAERIEINRHRSSHGAVT